MSDVGRGGIRTLGTTSTPAGELALRWRLTGWRNIAGTRDVARQRTLFSWIHIGEAEVGALRFQQIDFEWGDNEGVFFTLDAESHELMKLGYVLTSCWPDVSSQVGDYGPVLDFQWLWMRHRFARGALWLPAARHFIDRTLGGYSIMVLQVFPLEFEGRAAPGSANEPLFQRRKRAMEHYYRKLLGVELMPGEHGREGWMWAPRPKLQGIIAPRRHKKAAK